MLNWNVMDTVIESNRVAYKMIVVVMSVMLIVLLGMQTQHTHALEGCPDGSYVKPLIDQGATQLMIEELNKRRAELGIPPMKLASELVNTAVYHSIDMQDDDYFKVGTFDRDASGELVRQCGLYKRIAQFYGDGTIESLDHAGEMVVSGDFGNNQRSILSVLDITNQIDEYDKLVNELSWEFGMGSAASPTTGFEKWTLTVGRRDALPPMIIDGEKATTVAEDGYVDIYTYGDWERIRFQNEDGAWSEWYVFNNEMEWGLITAFPGEQMITVEVVADDGTSYTTSDTIVYDPPAQSGVGLGAGGSMTVTPPDGLVVAEVEEVIPLQVGLSSVNSIGADGMSMSMIIILIMSIATVGIVSRQVRDF